MNKFTNLKLRGLILSLADLSITIKWENFNIEVVSRCLILLVCMEFMVK